MTLEQLNSNFKNLPKDFPENLRGKWAATLDGNIILHDKSFKVVFSQATKKGISKKVLFHRIPEKEIQIL